MIEFASIGNGKTTVKQDGKLVGEIKIVSGGYQYFPKGQKRGGEVFPVLSLCKYSLLGD